MKAFQRAVAWTALILILTYAAGASCSEAENKRATKHEARGTSRHHCAQGGRKKAERAVETKDKPVSLDIRSEKGHGGDESASDSVQPTAIPAEALSRMNIVTLSMPDTPFAPILPVNGSDTSFESCWKSILAGLLVLNVFGIRPSDPDWHGVVLLPSLPEIMGEFEVMLSTSQGIVTLRSRSEKHLEFIVPNEMHVDVCGVAPPWCVDVQRLRNGASRPVSNTEREMLRDRGWDDRLGKSLGVWVSVGRQQFRLVCDGSVLWETPCSTARNGIGAEMGSMKTPLGWHAIAEKYGGGRPWGTVFENTKATGKCWSPGEPSKEDLILTRVMVLDGLEEGKNKGGTRDSRARGIYIHGTNDEAHIGAPVSHGCVRLRNDDVLAAFDRIPAGTPVLISE